VFIIIYLMTEHS